MKIKTGILLASLGFLVITSSVFAGYKYFSSNNQPQKEEVLGESKEENPTPSPTFTSSPVPTSKAVMNNTIVPVNTPMPTSPPSPHVSQDDLDNSKLQSIKNIFSEIGKENVKLTAALLTNSSISSSKGDYGACRDKYSNIFDPFAREDLIKRCQEVSLSYLNHLIDTAPILSKISELSRQAYNAALTCGGSTCIDFYWGVVNGLEAKGLVAR